MKRFVFVLFVLLFASGVLAMEDPVRVKANPGDQVRVYVWLNENGNLVNSGKGVADEDGYFNVTFFSLNARDVKFQIVVRDNNGIKEGYFMNHSLDKALDIDCSGPDCVRSFFGNIIKTVVVEEVENVSVEIENVSVEAEENASFNQLEDNNILTGKVISGFSNFNLSKYSFISLIVLFFVIIFVFMMKRGRKEENIVSEDEKELEYMEKRIKDVEEKIGKIKSDREKKEKIENVKQKLAVEEAELRDLEGERVCPPETNLEDSGAD